MLGLGLNVRVRNKAEVRVRNKAENRVMIKHNVDLLVSSPNLGVRVRVRVSVRVRVMPCVCHCLTQPSIDAVNSHPASK